MFSFSNKYIALTVIASFIFGYEVAVLNPTLPYFTNLFTIKNNVEVFDEATIVKYVAMVRTAVFVGATVGSMSAGHIGVYGRRSLLMSCFCICMLGGLIGVLAKSFIIFTVARFISGLAVGLATVGCPSFISEISQVSDKGSKGIFHQFFICFGILIVLLLGFGLPILPLPDGQTINFTLARIIFCVPAALSLVALFVQLTILKYDTPLSYVEQGNSKSAIAVLTAIYKGDTTMAEEQFDQLSESISQRNYKSDSEVVSIFTNSYYRYALIVGCALAISQQIGGINCFVSMSTDIFIAAGLSPNAASLSSVFMALANLLTTIPSIFLVERVGRKILLLTGTLGQALFLSIVPIVHLLKLDIALGSAIAVVGFIICFSLAQGPVIWVYLFEMFPTEIKGTATSFASASNWTAAIIMVYMNSLFNDARYTVPKFVVFMVLCALTYLFMLVCVKETKGATKSPYSPPEKSETSHLIQSSVKQSVV